MPLTLLLSFCTMVIIICYHVFQLHHFIRNTVSTYFSDAWIHTVSCLLLQVTQESVSGTSRMHEYISEISINTAFDKVSPMMQSKYTIAVLLWTVTKMTYISTTSHVRCIWMCNEIEGSYDKIIITIVPSYTGKNITRLLLLALLLVLRTRNNTDGNKLVIFSGIALYYGDNYILKS